MRRTPAFTLVILMLLMSGCSSQQVAPTDPERDPWEAYNRKIHAFNMGIGWVAIVSPDDADAACAAGPGGVVLGEIRSGDGISVTVQS